MMSDTFKTAVGVGSLFVAMGIVGGAVGVSYARADTGSFLSTMDNHGVYYNDAGKMLDAGKAVCAELRGGAHVLWIRHLMTSHGITVNDAALVITGAVSELCPDMGAVVQAELRNPRGQLA